MLKSTDHPSPITHYPLPITSLYIHWPFCLSKCPYCDFNSHVRDQIDPKAWQDAYLKELDYFADYLEAHQISSIFFGGGTPSLMPADVVATLIDTITSRFKTVDHLEITLEANPTSVETKHFKSLNQAGINRISLGIQSFQDEALKFLGREHSSNEAMHAIDTARSTFDRHSFDLIYTRPDQTLTSWEKELAQALDYVGDHLSLYQLTIEKGTPFYKAFQTGEFTLPTETESADFYELTQNIMESINLPAYEISNHAKPGQECQHNLAYWHYQDYLGIGPGAHSRIMKNNQKTAIMMTHHPEKWLEQVESRGHGIQNEQPLSNEEAFSEFLLMGLRLTEGVSFNNIDSHYIEQLQSKIPSLVDEGLVENIPGKIQLTRKGMLVTNKVVEFLNSN